MIHRSLIVLGLASALVACSRTTPPPAQAPEGEATPAPPAAAEATPAPTAAAEGAPSHAAPEEAPDFRATAQAALGPLKKGLMGALQTAMAAEGPAGAVTACQLEAPKVAAAARTAEVKVGRSSHKLRNPQNAPAPWLAPLVDGYAKAGSTKGAPQVVPLDDGRFGYVEPIYLGGLCLTCHGAAEQIPDEVEAKLAELYPTDQATGFAAGDFRGVFWVESLPGQ